MKLKLCTVLLAASTIFTGLSLAAPKAPSPAAKGAVAEAYGKLPLSFEPMEDSRLFLAHSGEYSVTVGAREASVTVTAGKSGKSKTMFFGFEHGNVAAPIEAMEPLPGVTNYYVGQDAGKWRLGVKNYAKVRAQGIYPGVDVVYYGDHRRLEFDFVVAPKANANAIAVTFSGMEKLYKDASGDLIAEVNGKPIRFAKPYAYQMVAGVSKTVAAEYELASAGKVRLRLGEYDSDAELIIDPVVSYATYLGGGNVDVANGIAVDSLGSTYITGETCSGAGFPLTTVASPNPSGFTFQGKCDAYVTKFSPDGTALVYTTIIGGAFPTNATASGYGIALDSANQAYVVGTTNIADLPGTIAATNPVTSTHSYQGGDSDAFIVILDKFGNFVRASYLGGSGADAGYGIAVDQNVSPSVTVVGQTSSDDFPAYNAFETKVEHYVAFVTKLDNNLNIASKVDGTIVPFASALTPAPASGGGKTYYFSEFYGGQPVAPSPTAGAWAPYTNYPQGAIVLDNQNPPNVEIALNSGTSGPYVPALTTGNLPIPNWNTSKTGITLEGSMSWENFGPLVAPPDAYSEAYGVALDPPGDVFLVGGTNTGALASIYWPCHYSGGSGAWVLKVYGTTGKCAYEWTLETTPTSTSLQTDTARAVAVDAAGRAYVTGTMTGGLRSASGTTSGGSDAFLIRINGQGSGIDYATYLGGSGNDQGLGVAVDGNFQAYVTGSTASADFPLINPLQSPTTLADLPLSGTTGAFVAKYTPDGSALIFSTYLGGSQAEQGNAIAVDSASNMYVAGNTTSTDLLTTILSPMVAPNYIAPQTTNAGNGDAFVAMIPGGSIPVVTLAPGSLAFGYQDLGTTSAAQPVRYAIEGMSAVNIKTISFTNSQFAQSFVGGSGGNSADCVANTAIVPTLTPPTVSGCTIWVVFTPTAQGTQLGTLNITDDASSKTHSINLSGKGASPTDIFSPVSLAFPSQIVGTTSTALLVSLRNSGLGILDIGTVAITGAEFSLSASSTCGQGQQLAAGSSCTFNVLFTPSGTGLRTGTLTITDNAAGSPHAISLTGTGAGVTAPTIAPPSVAFGNQALNSTSTATQVTITNPAVASLLVGSVAISGTNPTDFTIQSNTCGLVLAGTSCSVNVTFTPTGLGSRSASLVITDNATNSPQSVPLSGSGIAATGAMSLSPSTVPFGSQQINTASADSTVTLANNSTTTALSISGITISGNSDFSVSSVTAPCLTTGSFTLPASGSCTIKVKFSPTAVAAETATLTVTSPSASSTSVSLTGTGTTATSSGYDYTLTPGATGVSVIAGSTATYTFSVAPMSGFKDSITFTCSGPVGSHCSVSPSPLAMDGTTSHTVTVSVYTSGGNGTSAKSIPLVPRSIFFALLPFSMMGMLLINKRRSRWLVLGLVMVCLLMGLASCGSGSGSGGSSSSGKLAPGTYQVTVSATSTGTTPVTHNVLLSLVVSSQ